VTLDQRDSPCFTAANTPIMALMLAC